MRFFYLQEKTANAASSSSTATASSSMDHGAGARALPHAYGGGGGAVSGSVVESLLQNHSTALGLRSNWSVRQALEIYRRAATTARGGNGALLMNARNPSTQCGAVALAYRASFVPAEGRGDLSRDALVVAMAKEISDVVQVGKLTVLGCYRKVLEPRMHLLLGPGLADRPRSLGAEGLSVASPLVPTVHWGASSSAGEHAFSTLMTEHAIGQKRKAED